MAADAEMMKSQLRLQINFNSCCCFFYLFIFPFLLANTLPRELIHRPTVTYRAILSCYFLLIWFNYVSVFVAHNCPETEREQHQCIQLAATL